MQSQYPWKVGAASFVIPASVEENVQFLGGKVDDIQLLFFESSWQARLPHTINTELLVQLAGEYGHSYTVHLPLDLQLGSADPVLRKRSVDEVCRIVDKCAGLDLQAYDLHLSPEKGRLDADWCCFCQDSLCRLQDRLGSVWDRICIENIDYDFTVLADLIDHIKAGVCVDFGHLHHQGYTDKNYFGRYDICHVHLHGVNEGRDHQPLTEADIPFLQRLGQEMADYEYGKVVTLELYKADWLNDSLTVLDQAWADFALL